MNNVLDMNDSHPGASLGTTQGFQHKVSQQQFETSSFIGTLPVFTASTNLQDVQEQVEKLLKQYKLDGQLKSLVIPENDYYSIILFYRKDEVQSKTVISYTPKVVLNGKPIIITQNGMSKEIDPEHAFLQRNILGDALLFSINETLLNVLKLNKENVSFNPGNIVIVKKEVDLTKEEVIKNMFVKDSLYSLYNLMAKQRLISEKQLKELYLSLKKGDEFSHEIEYSKGSKNTLTNFNHVIRTDIVSKFSQEVKNNWASSLMSKTVIPVCESGGFVELTIKSVNENGLECLKFYPRFVQTHFEQKTESKAYNATSLLMSIAMAAQSVGGEEWFKTFRPPVTNKKDKNYKDITGFIPYSGKPYMKNNIGINTPGLLAELSPEMVDTELVNILRTYSLPGTFYSMDVAVKSVGAFAGEDIIDAADGNSTAILNILNMANNLTDGVFGSIYNSTENPLLTDSYNNFYMPTGTWVDRSGDVKDLRTADLLYHMNLNYNETAGKTSDLFSYGSVLTRYTDLFVNGSNYDDATRIEKMKEHYRNVLGDSVTFTGIVRRVTFNPKFIEAFLRSIESLINISVKTEKLAYNNYNITYNGAIGASTAGLAGYSSQQSFINGHNQWRRNFQ